MMSGRLFRESVAVYVLAATLAALGCQSRESRGELEPARAAPLEIVGSARQLSYRWLLPPDPGLEPGLAAPLELAVDAERRRLLILESRPPGLRVYDAVTGQFIRTLGGAGDGPGEYRYPISLAVNRRGLAAVLSMSGRVTFWGVDHRLLGGVRTGLGLPTDIMAGLADSFWVKVNRFPPLDVAEFRIVTPGAALPGARFDDEALLGSSEPVEDGRNHSYAVAASGVGGVLLSLPGPHYVIVSVSSSGKVDAQVRRSEVPPLRRSAAEVEAIRRRVRRNFAALGRSVPKEIDVPIFRSHIAQLAMADDGSLWALTQRGDSGISVLDHFDPHGRFRGSHQVGLRVIRIAATDKRLYLLSLSKLDVAGVAVVDRPDVSRSLVATE